MKSSWRWTARRLGADPLMKLTIGLAAVAGVAMIIASEPETEARILVTSMTLLATTFTLMYVVLLPWRASHAGRVLVYTSGALALLGWQLLSRWWLGAYPFFVEVRDGVFLLLVLTLLYRILVLIKIRRKGAE